MAENCSPAGITPQRWKPAAWLGSLTAAVLGENSLLFLPANQRLGEAECSKALCVRTRGQAE